MFHISKDIRYIIKLSWSYSIIWSLAEASGGPVQQINKSDNFDQIPEESGSVDLILPLQNFSGLQVVDYKATVKNISKVLKKREICTIYTENMQMKIVI